MIDARALHYFLRVVELGSINRAGEDLNLSQPTLSRAIQMLEDAIGEALLIRTPRGVQATEAGDLLIERSRPILAGLETLGAEIAGSSSGRIALGLPISMRRVVTLPLTRGLLGAYPGLRTRLYEGINNNLRAWMEEGVLDIAVVVGLEQVPAHFDATPLVAEPLHLIGRDLGALGARPRIAIADLGGLDMILPGRPNSIRAFIEHAMQRSGFAYRCTVEAETLATCIELAREGLGCSIVPSCALAGEAGLQSRPLADGAVAWNLCTNRARRHSRLLRQVAGEIMALVARKAGGADWPEARLPGGIPARSTPDAE